MKNEPIKQFPPHLRVIDDISPEESLTIFKKKSLWEILVPCNWNNGTEIHINHHQEWDKKVRQISGGLTIHQVTKGQWINPKDNSIFEEPMIPVRILCTRNQILEILEITINHYKQKEVLAYEISNNYILYT